METTNRKQRQENLNYLLESHNMTRSDLAKRLETSKGYVSNLFSVERSFGEKAARTIERKMGMPTGYLDKDDDDILPVENWVTTKDLDAGVYGLVPHVVISIGSAGFEHKTLRLPPMAFREDWLKDRGVTGKGNLRVFHMVGPSMEPYLRNRDQLLIDLGQNILVDGEVFLIKYGVELRIARLYRRIDGSVRIKPDNAAFPEDVATPDQVGSFGIVGRCISRTG